MEIKDMVKLINALTRIIDKQAEAMKEMNRKYYNMERHISQQASRIGRLEGLKEREL